jgi:hypothetical protein
VLAGCGSFGQDEGQKNRKEGGGPTQEQETSDQAKGSKGNHREFSHSLPQKAHGKLEQTHGPGKNPFQQPDLTEREMEFGGDKRKKEIDGIGKPVIDKVIGAK